MTESLLIFIVAAISVIAGVFAGIYIQGLKSRTRQSAWTERENQLQSAANGLRSEIEKLHEEKENIQRDKEAAGLQLARKEVELEKLTEKNREQKEEVEKLQEKFTREFENLANRILDEKSDKFTSQNKENLDAILKPFQEQIKNFEKRIEDTNKEDIDRTADLRRQILGLKELNQQMAKEATNLTKALKGDTKMQGNWGELVLERILERSGLRKDEDYFVQQSFISEDGRRVMPDVIIHMPGDKKMIVDSKVSLVAYEQYVNEEDEAEKSSFLKKHLISVRKRVSELAEKNYHQLYDIESPDFVLLFIPIESAFAVASMENPSLYSDAFDKNIIIVTPTTLLAVLKTIDSMWQNERQKQNALEIAKQAGALYDNFVNLTDELIKVGKQLGTVQSSYESTMKKLTGNQNLVKKVEKLKELGAKASKSINEKLLKRAGEDEEE